MSVTRHLCAARQTAHPRTTLGLRCGVGVVRETWLTHTVNNVNRQKAVVVEGLRSAIASENPEPFFLVNSRSLPKRRLSSCRSVIPVVFTESTRQATRCTARRRGRSTGVPGAPQSVTVAVFLRKQGSSSSSITTSKQIESSNPSPTPARQLASARVK